MGEQSSEERLAEAEREIAQLRERLSALENGRGVGVRGAFSGFAGAVAGWLRARADQAAPPAVAERPSRRKSRSHCQWAEEAIDRAVEDFGRAAEFGNEALDYASRGVKILAESSAGKSVAAMESARAGLAVARGRAADLGFGAEEERFLSGAEFAATLRCRGLCPSTGRTQSKPLMVAPNNEAVRDKDFVDGVDRIAPGVAASGGGPLVWFLGLETSPANRWNRSVSGNGGYDLTKTVEALVENFPEPIPPELAEKAATLMTPDAWKDLAPLAEAGRREAERSRIEASSRVVGRSERSPPSL